MSEVRELRGVSQFLRENDTFETGLILIQIVFLVLWFTGTVDWDHLVDSQSRDTLFRGNKNYTDVSAVFGVSRHVFKMMEIGAHDFTLSQLHRISEIMGQSISDIITPMTGVSYRQPIKRPRDQC